MNIDQLFKRYTDKTVLCL